MKKYILISLAIVLIITPSMILAQEKTDVDLKGEKKIGKGTVEISANFTGTMFGVATIPSINYFITDNIEVGGAFHFEDGEIEDIDYDVTGFSLLGIYNFYPKNIKKFIPFAQVGFNYASGDIDIIDVDGTGLLIGGGARYLITDNFSVNGILSHQFGDLEYTRLGIGLSVFIQ